MIKKLRENAGAMNPQLAGEMRNALILGTDGLISPVQTEPDGRFRLTRVGRDRAALLLIHGAAIEQSFAMVYTASDPTYRSLALPNENSGEWRLLEPRFELTVAPGRAIEGVIRDSDSGRPVSGGTRSARGHSVSTRRPPMPRDGSESPGSPREPTTSSKYSPRASPTSRSINRSAIYRGWDQFVSTWHSSAAFGSRGACEVERMADRSGQSFSTTHCATIVI